MKKLILMLILLLTLVSCGRDENYYKECGLNVFKNTTNIYYPNAEAYYLGEYNNYHFVVIHNYHTRYQNGFHDEHNYKKIENIDGIEFIYYCDSYHIFGFKTGKEDTMLELKKAYDDGIISLEDLNDIKTNIGKIDFSMYNKK